MILRALTLTFLLLNLFFRVDLLTLQPACEPAYAQSVTATPISGGGMIAILFNTKNGQLRINLPDDTTAGDTISGSVILEPKGRSPSELTRNEDELNGYVFEVADQPAPCRLGDFKTLIPKATDLINLTLKDKKGTKVYSNSVKINTTPPPLPCAKYPNTCMLPPFAQAGWPIQCRGPCDGDFNTSSIRLGNRECVKFCESPRKIVAECPNDMKGATTIEMREGDLVASAPCSVVAVELQCGLTDIERGKKTTLTVTVTGLENLSEPVNLEFNNLSPNIVQVDGGDKQKVAIAKQNGPWQRTIGVSAVRSGGFSFVAWILEPPIINVTRFQSLTGAIPESTPTATPVQQPPPATIAGSWSSNYGPLVLELGPAIEGQVQSVKGYWQQAADKRGSIQEGTFDPKSGTVNISYYQDWNNVHGTASFNLSADGRTLNGTWAQEGTSGKWILAR